jgi:hypothetical protein
MHGSRSKISSKISRPYIYTTLNLYIYIYIYIYGNPRPYSIYTSIYDISRPRVKVVVRSMTHCSNIYLVSRKCFNMTLRRTGGFVHLDGLKNNDEALITWKSRLIFTVHMRDKSDRYDIKAYLVFDSMYGYICNMVVYLVSRQITTSKNLCLERHWAQLVNKGYHFYSTRTITVTVLKWVRRCWKRNTCICVYCL